MTDEELVALARQGDADAFDQLVTRHQHAVYRTTLAALRDREDAEEAAQDALVRAWSSLGRFRSESSFRTWLLAIAWNCALRRRRSVVQWLRRRAPVDEAHVVAVTGSNPETESADRALRVVVAAEIERLTPKLRDALLLAQSGDHDYGEIAEMLQIPIGTLKWRVSEARKRLKTRLQGLGYVRGS